MKRRNDPTSAKVSTILGSYDKAKELVTSSHMIGAILQPATPRPSKGKDAAGPGLLTTTPPTAISRPGSSNNKQPAGGARSGVKAELGRQGVFEQFQSSVVSNDGDSEVTEKPVVSRQSTDHQVVDAVLAVSDAKSSSRRSSTHGHIANGRHKSSASSSSAASSKHKHSRPRPQLSIPSPKV